MHFVGCTTPHFVQGYVSGWGIELVSVSDLTLSLENSGGALEAGILTLKNYLINQPRHLFCLFIPILPSCW